MATSMFSRRSFARAAALSAAGWSLPAGFVRAQELRSDDDVVFLAPAQAGYAAFATLFNARIDSAPRLIAACSTEEGVRKALEVAAGRDLAVAVKSGGHCFEGLSHNDEGLVIDVSRLAVQGLDSNVYTVGPGVRLADAFGFLLGQQRLVPLGSCGGVGIAGLTLGGGYGMFSRRLGLTCDNLSGLRIVTGRGVVLDSDDDPELLWACRGGGNGNFGVVTELRFATHAAPPTLPRHRFRFVGLDATRAAGLCRRWFEETARLTDDSFSAFVLNGNTLTVLITWFDPESAAAVADVAARLAQDASTVADPAEESIDVAVTRYYGARQPTLFKNVSAGYYQGFADLEPAIEDVFAGVIDGSGLIFQINTLGGAIDDPRREAGAAYPHRGYAWLGELQCYWDRPEQTAARVEQVVALEQTLQAMNIRRHYCNYRSLEIAGWEDAYYGTENYRRLQSFKAAHDPDDRIRHAQSIRLPQPA